MPGIVEKMFALVYAFSQLNSCVVLSDKAGRKK